MDNILLEYQGREIEVTEVNCASGDIPILPEKWANGAEELYRNQEGQYYLRRQFRRLDIDTPQERRASGRAYVHRLSLKAAALWAAARTMPQTLMLRHDLADALLPELSADAILNLQCGNGEVWNVPLNAETMTALRHRARQEGVTVAEAFTGIIGLAVQVGRLIDPVEPVKFEPRVEKMLARYCARLGEDRGDVVNAWMLNTLKAVKEGQDSHGVGYDVDVRAAKRRRLRRTRKEHQSRRISSDNSSLQAAANRPDAALCAAFEPNGDDDESEDPPRSSPQPEADDQPED